MAQLNQQKCEACSANSQPITQEQIQQLKPEIPEWDLIDSQGEAHLQRTYQFPDFKTALDFTNKVGNAAEAEGHHPAITTEYGKATVNWWTHAISGLHRNDFIMAAKTDELAQSFS
ncbi:4a-hydroxytetrahydrobiopterin dehydratase [Lyngbya sp. PCC 8106]|uniref:4a-hydroxytetrahydrobiopterin dehydratase n=1 Tax=Lyngbya sp. (strain PCC 8106) TaxID=313612 RepID=UPI0000EACBF4|nr:4a-hydroxytetrahydrobiopterin dehydratase [Lyngbya sp. PCC 8106]EAW37915.1 Transcriptional coactivator/pterin dehydratase [Lyngbya sp. PCC 8106]